MKVYSLLLLLGVASSIDLHHKNSIDANNNIEADSVLKGRSIQMNRNRARTHSHSHMHLHHKMKQRGITDFVEMVEEV